MHGDFAGAEVTKIGPKFERARIPLRRADGLQGGCPPNVGFHPREELDGAG